MAKNRKKLNTSKPIQRDGNILLAMKGEINMTTRCTTPNKKRYTRKSKHKNKCFEY